MRPSLAPYAVFKRMISSHTIAHVATCIGISLATAYRWRKSGPPKKAGRKADRPALKKRAKLLAKISRTTRKVGSRVIPLFPTAPRITARFRVLTGEKIHPTTCLRLLRSVGYNSYVRPRHPNLKNNERRLAFAKKWRRFDSSRIVFSDEHFISTNDNTNRRMIGPCKDDILPREFQRRQNIPNFQIWAAIGVGWRSQLVFFPKVDPDDDSSHPGGFRLNADRYVRRCLSKICSHLSGSNLVFMQDGARCHTARTTLAYLERKGIKFMEDYPSHSPDLNPIESVWALLDTLIAERLTEQSDVALMAAARAAWSEIDQRVIDAHVRSFRSKCEKLVKTGGI